MSNKPTILVTGGAGYIGSHAVLALREHGFPVVVVDNLSTGHANLVPKDVSLVIQDVGDAAAMEALLQQHKIAAVLHFAGSIIVPESVANPTAYYHNNTANSLQLIKACVAAEVRYFIFSSTAAVYGIPEHNPVTEDSILRPINPYGTSKLMTEWMLRDTAYAHDFRYVALRYFNVAGADLALRSGQISKQTSHLIKTLAEVACGKRDAITVFGKDYATPDGTCVRDFIHVSDLADAHVHALNYLLQGGISNTLNCGYSRGYSVREVLDSANRVLGRSLPHHYGPRRAGDPPALISNIDKLHQYLAWQPRFQDLDVIVKSAFDWENTLLP